MANESEKISYGGDMMIFVGSGANKYPIAFSTNASLEITTATREISSKDSGYWQEFLAGKLGWSMNSDALYSYVLTGTTRQSYDDLYTLMVAREPVDVVFARRSGTSPNWTIDSTAKTYSGKAIITNLPVTAPDNESSTFSISLQGTGELTQST